MSGSRSCRPASRNSLISQQQARMVLAQTDRVQPFTKKTECGGSMPLSTSFETSVMSKQTGGISPRSGLRLETARRSTPACLSVSVVHLKASDEAERAHKDKSSAFESSTH